MVDINFELPINRNELLDNFRSGYSIKYLSSVSEIPKKLKDAYICLKEEGVMYILENFDVYYSVLHYSDRLSKELIIKAYDDLECAVAELNNRIKYMLDDKDNLTDDLKAKMLLIIKMLIYIYTQFIQYLDEKNNSNHDLVVKGKIKPKNNPTLYDLNKAKILLLLNNLIQQQINLFWQPPLVEDTFLNIIAEIGYILLRNPSIKHEKNQLLNEIFGLFGNLIKSHNYGTTFIIRIVQSIKIIEHLPNIVADGVKFLIEHFKCNELIHYLIREATEWQTEDGYEDTQGARYCSQFLTNLATTMPDLILPELEYLDRYLYHDSVPLRTSILNMYTEVLLNVLTKHDLNLKEKESRDMLLTTLFEHIGDVAANVRSKVIQNLSRLQENNSIPLTLQNKLLERIIKHLYDKTALVRKASIQSITIFLSYNSYGADLQLKRMQNELERKTEMLNQIEEQYINEKMKYLNEMEEKWLKIQQQLHDVIKIELENDDDDDEDDDDNVEIDVKTIQTLLNQQDFVKAFKLCRKLDHECTDNEQLTQIKNNGDEVDFYMFVLKTIYLNITNTLDQLRLNFGMSKEDLEKIKTLEKQITYCKQTTDFLILIDSTLEPMKDLLFTETISDMHSAIEFFVTAFRFNIDNINDGILTMLNLMKENEQERKDAVINAYQKIFLTTTSKNLEDHATTVVNNLINLLDNLPVESIDDFKNILSNWSKKRMIGNDIIDMLWKYFTKNLNNINNKQSCSATDLLYITSLGRKSIIEKNLKLVSTIGFGQRGRDDLLFLASSCRLLTTICNEQIDITSKQLPYRFNYNDDIFNDLIQILVDLFMEPVQYYLEAFREAINFIYKTSSKPSANCEKLFNEISIKLNDRIDHPHYILIRLFSGIGNIALRQLSFLDDTVYRELKRRHNCHESEKENRKLNQRNKQINNKRTSIFNKNRSSQISMIEESILEGAQAEDVNAEFILNVIENDLLSSKNFLGRFSELLIKFCSKSNLYDPIVQGVAVNTLARYMLISNKFCKDNIRLFFTILERTNQPEIKCTILIHCVDLITRFSNDVEPWIGRIYDQLKNDNVRVRKFAFFSISNLILRDMIRTSNYISELALCLIDETDEIRSLGKQFFTQLSQKDNNLANLIPDIFSHLIKMENLNEENLRYIMKFLFDFVNNTKHMEALVGRFVVKLNLQYNEKDARNIMYCLSLITYSDKALKKLQDNFGLYKNILHIEEVYTFIKQILNECNKIKPGKPDLRPIVAEIEANIQTVFENDGTKPPIITKPMINNRNRRKKPKNRKRKSNNNHNNDDDSDDDRAKNQSATTSKIDRPKRRRQAKQIVDDTSDTD